MMVSTYTLIEQFHSLSKESKISQNALTDKLERFIDILTARVHHKDLEALSSGLLDDVLELRLKAIQSFLGENENVEHLINELAPTLKSSYKNLNTIFNEVVSMQFEISSNILNSNNSSVSFNGLKIDSSISFSGLKKLVELYPVPNIMDYLKWMENSLKLEIGMIICALIEDEVIKVPNGDFIQQLEYFLKNKLELFGAYAILLDIWQPNESDERQLINNIKIVASAYELDAKKGKRISSQDLQNLLLVA
ncbi:MAG: hypothetical protein ACPGXZ_12295 [Saprospiraceae bacterium]